MPAIRCYSCQQANPAHLVGSLDELRYYSVSDHGPEARSGKIFFCGENCYLESIFISKVVAASHALNDTPDDMRPTLRTMYTDSNLGPIADEMHPHFSDIVEPYMDNYGLNQFKERQKKINADDLVKAKAKESKQKCLVK